MGVGSSIKFWHDPWFRGLSLKDNFPELYSIACNRDASVAELLALSWHRSTVIWAMIPQCLMWAIWWERNAHTFEGNERSIHDLILLFLQTLLELSNASSLYFCFFS